MIRSFTKFKSVAMRRGLDFSTNSKKISKILVANRGEIACRIMRTAKKMGIQTVAVYSDADRNGVHVSLADEAVHIGPAQSSESYLCGEKIIEACRQTGAQAVHPGYGFLSENLVFRQLCDDANVIFIGPSAEAIRIMGSKSESKDAMIAAKVPVVPGYHGANASDEVLLVEARKMGWPIMVKAVAGGGGKGMRAVEKEEDFMEAVNACRREAKKSFNDDTLLLEKLIRNSRHVELQVFGDQLGNVVHLMDRDCSIQRRHQKVLEEAPAPGLPPLQRKAMADAAKACAKAVNYVGAGTVEFLVDPATFDFYFCEMNTRLQVEHPVTEMVTGVDLVEWQILVASGLPIPKSQEAILEDAKGCAIEARIYSENSMKGFLPAVGTLTKISSSGLPGVRLDTGVKSGSTITPFYDPMIAKLIVHDVDRSAAIRKMERALRELQIAGVPTNVDFLLKIVQHETFEAIPTTAFFVNHLEEIMGAMKDTFQKKHMVLGLSALYQTLLHPSHPSDSAGGIWRQRPFSSRLNRNQDMKLTVAHIVDETNFDLSVNQNQISYAQDGMIESLLYEDVQVVQVDAHNMNVSVKMGNLKLSGSVAHSTKGDTTSVDVWLDGQIDNHPTHYQFKIINNMIVDDSNVDVLQPLLKSPMPGRILKVNVKNGDTVNEGDILVVIEAMKMEHTIRSKKTGTVKVFCIEGSSVDEGAKLVEVN